MSTTNSSLPPLRYLALGDSTSVGVGAGNDGGFPSRLARRLCASGFSVELTNLGRSGATTQDLVRDLTNGPAGRAVRERPALLTLGIGNNDAWRMVPTEVFATRLRRIADVLEESGARVVVCNIPDLALAPAAAVAQAWLGVAPEQITSRVAALNAHLEQEARRPGFALVDLFGHSRFAIPGRSELFSPDGFHPSAAGYDAWAEACWPAVLDAAEAALGVERRGGGASSRGAR